MVAADPDEWVALVVQCSFWRDLLKYSAGGDLAQMHRAAAALEDDYADADEFLSLRESMRARLGLNGADGVIARLHAAVSRRFTILDLWGQPAEPLFGRFTIDDMLGRG